MGRYSLTPEQVVAELAALAAQGLVRIYRPQERPRRCVVRLSLPPAAPRGRRGPVTPRW